MNNNKMIESTDKCILLGIPLHACTLNNEYKKNIIVIIINTCMC